MKKNIFIFVQILLLIAMNLVFPQEKSALKTKSFIEIDVNSSYNYALFDLRGSGGLKSFYSFKDYGVGSGFGINTEIKIGLFTTKMSQLKMHLMLGYSHFANEDSKAYSVGGVDPGWPYVIGSGYQFSPKDTSGTSYLRINIPHFAVGLECSVFTDKENKSAFNFGLDFTSSLITGRAYETIVNSKETYITIYPSLRFGLGINTSYTYRFGDWVGFNIGTRFVMPNLLGKSSEMTDQSGYISLLDDSNTALNSNLSSKRNLGYLQLFGGVCFYLGKM
jgi:hypothetical protein